MTLKKRTAYPEQQQCRSNKVHSMPRKRDIEKLRLGIDELDEEILRLVNIRVEQAKEVGAAKRESLDKTIYRPEREAQILNRLNALNPGPLEPKQIQTIFREIISISRAAESRPRVAVLGPAGTYSQSAAIKHFGHEIENIFVETLEDVFRLVGNNQIHYGVVPVENSTEGGISNTLDCLLTTPLSIVGEITLRVSHALLGKTKNTELIRTILGHEQALAQCRLWLDRHLPTQQRVAVSSNAEAARQASENVDCVAVAGKDVAEIYELEIISQGIEDQSNNSTRFFVISDEAVSPSGRDKISLLFSSRNQAGSLHHLLAPLSNNGISMTRIESRPSRTGLWEYIFFVDVEGHVNDENVRKALTSIEEEAALFKILGCYPQAI
jgi:chorismate mutase/prephenate dehydratase